MYGLEFKELWGLVVERFNMWWKGELKNPLIQIIVPRKGFEDRTAVIYNRWHWGFARNPNNPSETIELFVEWCKNTVFLVDSYPNLWINLGPGIVAGYFGAKVVFKNDTVWFGASADPNESKDWSEIDHMVEFSEGNFWWRKTLDITIYALRHGGGRYVVGITDLGGVHDILASLRGTQNLIKDMYYNPQKVEEISWKILGLWHIYYDKLYEVITQWQHGISAWMGLWSPRKWYPIQCDLSALLSPKLFQKFIFPILEEQCNKLNHTIYHLDGPGELPHIDYILGIDRLNGIQWVPGAAMEALNRDCGSEYWLPLYRKILEHKKNLVLYTPYNRVIELLEKLPTTRGVAIQTFCPDSKVAKTLIDKLIDKGIIDWEFYRETLLLN